MFFRKIKRMKWKKVFFASGKNHFCTKNKYKKHSNTKIRLKFYRKILGLKIFKSFVEKWRYF